MEQKNATTSDEQLTNEELRQAGASEQYIAYYYEAMRQGIETASTRHAKRVVRDGVEYSGGGFHDALWDATERFPRNDVNPYGADTTNSHLLADAGIDPYRRRKQHEYLQFP
jgi:hypothetical protein